MTYVVITFVVLLILNIYCSKTCQELFYESKKASMVEKCLLASDEIGKLDVLNPSTVAEAVSQMESLKVTRLIVTDQSGNALFDSVDDFVEIHMPWHDVVLRADNADQRLADFGVAKTECFQETALWCGIDAFGKRITSHGYPFFLECGCRVQRCNIRGGQPS